MGASHNAECALQGDTYTEINECIEGRALREAPHVSHRRIEGLALREAPHVSHKVANEGKSEFEPIRIDPLNCDGFGGPSRAKLTSTCGVNDPVRGSPVMGSDEHHRLNKTKHQELLRERHELVKNILEKDPLSGKPWNI